MGEWKEKSLIELADIIPGFAFKSNDFGPIGEIVIKIKDIHPPLIDLSSTEKVNTSNYDKNKLKKYLLEYGDFVVAMTGATIGKVGRLKEKKPAFINQRVAKINAKKGVNNDFIYYSVTSYDFQVFIQNNIDSHSAQENISGNSIGRFPILAPPLPEQTAIASILSSLDDKIDLLHRQNATLEKMAETLFRQWFVEEAKEEWESKQLKEVTDIAIGRTPPRKESKWFTTNPLDIKWISIKDLGDDGMFISNTTEYLTKEAVDTFNIPVIPKDTIVLSFKMTVGRVAITSEEMLSNEAIAHFKFNNNTPFCKEYLYLFLKTYKYETLGSTSSIVTAINSAMIKEMGIVIPNECTMMAFKEESEPLFNKIKSNQTQIRTITALRDTLLPKLMSGEVRVEPD
jgi:type I restriction enzyme S subunit